MANFFSVLDDKLTTFIRDQHIYFVATAASSGRVNLSPKGMDTFRVFSTGTLLAISISPAAARKRRRT